MKLIIVDDKEAEILVKFFEMVEIDVIGFTCGPDALEWLKENEAKVAVSDLAMIPSGLAFVKELRGIYPEMRIAFMSGYPPDEVIRRTAKKYRVEKIFEKGNDSLALVKEIKDWVLSK